MLLLGPCATDRTSAYGQDNFFRQRRLLAGKTKLSMSWIARGQSQELLVLDS